MEETKIRLQLDRDRKAEERKQKTQEDQLERLRMIKEGSRNLR